MNTVFVQCENGILKALAAASNFLGRLIFRKAVIIEIEKYKIFISLKRPK